MSKTPIINAQLDAQNEILSRIADKLGAYESPATWAAIQAKVRAGTIGQYVRPGDQMAVEAAETLSVSVSGTGVTAATVNKDTFLAIAGTHHRDYEFTYDGAMWHYLGETVTLSDYGITPTGTPAEGDVIDVHRTATTYNYDVEGIDEECPAKPGLTHALSLIMHPVLSQLNFDPPSFLYAVTAAKWPSGMPAGTYTITLNHGAYNGGTAQDGTYAFTTTQTIPVGGGIRHSAIGAYQSGSYTKTQITNGTFTTYDSDKTTTIETGLATTESDTGTSLGTTTACDPQYKSDADYLNFTQRNAYGSNRWSTSWLRQWLNSDEASFTWTPATIWSRPGSGVTEGFLHTLDPELRAVLGKIRKRYALSIADGYGYEDVEDFVTLDTMLDVGFGANNSISEGPVRGGEVTRTTAMSLWQGATNADRIKYQGTTARLWWLGSAYPSYAYSERVVSTSGALVDNGAYGSNGVVPRLQII